ncbi:MAG TPA: FmdB family transcriptional regulator [Trueperaceae bacterium]|nr:FmdB family transcriptional regulator [Trueperaceae bacterium]
MPVYVYRNLVTNETFELHQSITDDPLTVDPRTGDPVKRIVQPVGIAFKGSGFYVNDSRRSSGSSGSSESKSESKSDPGASGGQSGGAAAD